VVVEAVMFAGLNSGVLKMAGMGVCGSTDRFPLGLQEFPGLANQDLSPGGSDLALWAAPKRRICEGRGWKIMGAQQRSPRVMTRRSQCTCRGLADGRSGCIATGRLPA